MRSSIFAIVRVLIVTAFIAITSTATAQQPDPAETPDLKINSMFTDHMVVQRERPLHVWGQAAPGASVEVRLGPNRAETRADPSGEWEVVLDPLPAGGPHVLKAKSGDKTSETRDVLVGDVWLCSGQSNMQMTLKDSDGGPAAADSSPSLHNLRLASVARKASATPEPTCQVSWNQPSPKSARDFSAVGFYFASALRANPALEGVPIGVIDSSFGGSTCEAWVPETALSDFNPTDLRPSLFGTKPSGYYNAMIAPLTRNPVRGVVWYQGESNADRPDTYPSLLGALISSWRHQFNSPDLPFIVIQLPDWVAGSSGFSWAWLREAQAKTVHDTPHTSLALGIQTTDGYNLHPREKAPIGRRAALCALRDVYHDSSSTTGPTFKEARTEGDTLRLKFHPSKGSLTTLDSQPPRGFAIAGPDGKYAYAHASIDGNSVLLKSDAVPDPLTVRYAWSGAPDATLTDRSGLPTPPFRTDTLAPPDVDVQRQPAPRHVHMKAYEVTVDGFGSVTSLGVGGKQFLSNALGNAGGTHVPAWLGARQLSNVREPGPGRILCGDSEVDMLLDFDETKMEWTITNRSSNPITFQIALAPRVSVSDENDSGTRKLSRGPATLSLTGAQTVSDSDEGPVLKVPVNAQSSKTLTFQFGG